MELGDADSHNDMTKQWESNVQQSKYFLEENSPTTPA